MRNNSLSIIKIMVVLTLMFGLFSCASNNHNGLVKKKCQGIKALKSVRR